MATAQWTEAERFLLDRVRQRDNGAWAQLVARYQGRLLAFARGRGGAAADAEDLVQETFLRLLNGLEAFRGEASLETYLFLLLRRRMIDWHRAQGGRIPPSTDNSGIPEPAASVETASRYAVRSEQLGRDRTALAAAIGDFAEELRREKNFRDLRLAEMLFAAQMRNQSIAAETGLGEQYVALLKHRWIKQLRGRIDAAALGSESDAGTAPGAESLLSEVWEDYRPTCPKRTTLGGYLLGTLDPMWHEYVDFHVGRLACRPCNANLADLRTETAAKPDDFRHRVLQSSAGFFRHA